MPELNPFAHPQNIRTGVGRILYGESCRPVLCIRPELLRSGPEFAGWVLPGGRRTLDRIEAEAAAAWIATNACV